ncbi:hypothetical protein ACS0PU_010335 [Formica fusca]
MTTVIWVILVGPVFGGRCGAEALGLGLGLSPGPAYRFALPPGLAAKTTRCLVFDQALMQRNTAACALAHQVRWQAAGERPDGS